MKKYCLFFLLTFLTYCPVAAKTTNKKSTSFKAAYILIEHEDVANKAPGVAIKKKTGVRYFTAAHWFPKEEASRYWIHLGKERLPIIRIKYLGNDIIELFAGKGKAPIITGQAPTVPSGEYAVAPEVTKTKVFEVSLLWGGDDTLVCFAKYRVVVADEQRAGYVCDTTGFSISEGNSGATVKDGEGNIYILSGTVDNPIRYLNEKNIWVKAMSVIFIQKLPL